MEDFFKIGIITGSHGVHGEMKIFPTTDDLRRFKKLKEVYLGTEQKKELVSVESVRVTADRALIKLAGIDTPEEVVKYRKKELFVDREHAVRLQRDEYFIADLQGMEVYTDEDRLLGTLTEVIETGANDVYAVKLTDGREVMIPAIRDCIMSVSVEENRMVVHLLDGLIEATES